MVGIDISTDMIAGARSRGIDARIMDGERLTFEGEFDAIFSNAALHWMLRSEDVIAGIARALRPGGRFVAEFGGYGNVATIVTALRELAQRHAADPELAGPWFFPTAEDYAAMLEDTGFSVTRAGLYPRPTFLPSGMAGWLQTFAKPFIDQFDAAKRPEVIAQAEALLRPSLCDGKVRLDGRLHTLEDNGSVACLGGYKRTDERSTVTPCFYWRALWSVGPGLRNQSQWAIPGRTSDN